MDDKIQPILKWVGGKTQILDVILTKIPESFETYYEPFVGGAAVLLELKPKKAVINDLNAELVNYYKVVRDNPQELIDDLSKHKNESDYFYEIRAFDRNHTYLELSDIERASRFQYLNKTSYSGLYRVNLRGEFNTPYGKYKKPNIINEDRINAVSKFFRKINIEILNTDFEMALSSAMNGDFVYLDPPYDVEKGTSDFTGYTANGFGKENQIKLKQVCDILTRNGVKFLLSNSNTEFIRQLYCEYNIEIVSVNRSINSKVDRRKKSAEEVLITNY